jgi:hypothetical protein
MIRDTLDTVTRPNSGQVVCGVWLSGTRTLSPIVWRVEWPEDIRNNVLSFDNSSCTITNSDLEMAGMLLHFLVLEHLVKL